MIRTDVIRHARRSRLKALAGRLVSQFGAVIAMATCTFLGYQLHALTAKTNVVSLFAWTYHEVSGAIRSFFDMDPVYAALFFPALLVAMLSLGGLYVWRQQDD